MQMEAPDKACLCSPYTRGPAELHAMQQAKQNRSEDVQACPSAPMGIFLIECH
jgi:hypothetical protein